MHSAEPSLFVAQTNLQLYGQMESLGYPEDEVAAVAAAYRGALPWFSAQYRGNGKPFIAHLVGTASLLASRRAPLSQVLAGLVHATFQAGDLGVDTGHRQTAARREALRRLVGAEAEELVANYDATDWKALLTGGALRTRQVTDNISRGTTYLFLANTLEDFLDGGMCGLAGTRKTAAFDVRGQEEVIALANDFDWPELAAAMQREFDRFNEVRQGASPQSGTGYSSLVLPPSARRRLVPTVLSFIVRARRWLARRFFPGA